MRPVSARKPAPWATIPRVRQGLCCLAVLIAAPSALSHELAEMASGLGGFVINGVDTGDRAGLSVSGAGDVNGDGLADVVVGAFQASPGVAREGAAYVVFGTVSTEPVELSEIEGGNGGFSILGIDRDNWTGFNVSGAGDVNGDGLDDLIVGTFDISVSFVVFGKTTTEPVNLLDVADGIGGFIMLDFHGSAFGAVSGAGDVNGDGRDDLIVGAGFFGDAYVVHGKANTDPVFLWDTYDGIGGFAILASGAQGGGAVSGAGDVNGDQLADVIVGQAGESPGGRTEAGRTYVIFGKGDTNIVDLAQIADGVVDDPALGYVINGIDAFDESGFSVSDAGDVNNDFLDDVIIGAPSASPFGFQSGESYVVFGKADTAPVELFGVLTGAGGFALRGIMDYDNSGFSVSGAGDVNGDSMDDVIVGAFGADANFLSRVGISYLVFGKVGTDVVDLEQVAAGIGGVPLIGSDENDQSGISVSGAGDVNGDGLSDVIIGADSADQPGQPDAGEAYVVFGGLLEPSTWVDFAHGGDEQGTFLRPFNTLAEALEAVQPGRAISIKGDTAIRITTEAPIIDQPVSIRAVRGPVLLGVAEDL